MYSGRLGHAGFRDGPRQRALFSAPRGMCADTNGTLLVADSDNACVRRIAADGVLGTESSLARIPAAATATSVIAVPGFKRSIEENMLDLDAHSQFAVIRNKRLVDTLLSYGLRPTGLGCDADEKATIAAGTVETLAGRCGDPGLADGPADEARFSSAVWDVHCAPHDCSVLVADPGNGALRRVTRDPGSCPKPPGEARLKGARVSYNLVY